MIRNIWIWIYFITNRYFILFFQTIIHWTGLMLSILFYFAFILIYNSFCITCFGLQNPYWVLHHSMGTAEFWLVILVSCVLALLPRYVWFYLLFKLGYNYLNFMLHKPEKFVKLSHSEAAWLFQKIRGHKVEFTVRDTIIALKIFCHTYFH